MSMVFSWRDQLIVEVKDGFRVNSTDEVYTHLDLAIAAIDTEMGGEAKYDLLCVLHNCLYWQCECGNALRREDCKLRAVEYLSANIGLLLGNYPLQQIGEDGNPDRDADPPMQVGNCETLFGGQWKNRGLVVELWNGTKFHVKIEVVDA